METEIRKCMCEEPQCAKCLSVNCEDKDCLVHTASAKVRWYKNREIGKKEPSAWHQRLWKRGQSAIFAIIAKFKKISENI